jgi:hypothetical protein
LSGAVIDGPSCCALSVYKFYFLSQIILAKRKAHPPEDEMPRPIIDIRNRPAFLHDFYGARQKDRPCAIVAALRVDVSISAEI